MPIRSFKDPIAEAVFNGQRPRSFPGDIAGVTRRKLQYLHAAVDLTDLRVPPGNHLQALKGDRAGQHSIRINDHTASASSGPRQAPRPSSSPTITEETAMTEPFEIVETLPPMHPGEVLREEFIIPMGITAGRVAKACGIARTRIERIVAEEIGISGDTALRLGRLFGTSPELWMNLQSRYEIETARAAIGESLQAINPIAA